MMGDKLFSLAVLSTERACVQILKYDHIIDAFADESKLQICQ